MIEVEHIIDGNKHRLTIMFSSLVMNHMKAKCDDYLNFYQSTYKVNFLKLFKADTGYRITRSNNRKKTYKIVIRYPLYGFRDFSLIPCTYYMKRNGFITILLKN